MADTSDSNLSHNEILSLPGTKGGKGRYRNKVALTILAFLAVVLLAPLIFAQEAPQVTGVDPSSGKVNDTVTVTGQNLGKDSVTAVFLSDDTTDYKATIVEQTAEKITVKIPEVKPGSYNLSIQVGNKIFIKPVRFTVQ